VFHSSYYRTPAPAGVVTVVTLHDFAYERLRCGPAKMIHSIQKFAAIRRASLVICISDATRRDALHYLPDQDPAKFVVVHHGASDSFYPQETGVAAFAKHVLFVGHRSGYKRFDIAMHAVREFEGMALHFTGQPPTASERRALNTILPGRWHHVGHMEMSELNALYNCAWALLYPSDHEGFGLPVLEAMRAGCPVICSNRSSLPEIGGSAAMYAKEQTAQAYAEQLQALAQPGEWRRRQEKGLLHAEPFSWEACAAKTVGFYERALNGRV
jgi:mannosyltransferase